MIFVRKYHPFWKYSILCATKKSKYQDSHETYFNCLYQAKRQKLWFLLKSKHTSLTQLFMFPLPPKRRISGSLIKTFCHECLSAKLTIKPKLNYHTCSVFAIRLFVQLRLQVPRNVLQPSKNQLLIKGVASVSVVNFELLELANHLSL